MTSEDFTFTIQYFKLSGKYYTETVLNMNVRACTGPGPRTAFMHDAVEKLQSMVRNKEQLPGLSSRGWEGHILIDCEDGFPCLIPNCRRDDAKGK